MLISDRKYELGVMIDNNECRLGSIGNSRMYKGDHKNHVEKNKIKTNEIKK